MKTNHLLIIDPQMDFMDLPGASLPVTGADADMRRLAALIMGNPRSFEAITVTLDSHELIDIGHPGYWLTADGVPPAPFTQVKYEDVKAGKIGPRDAAQRDYVLNYLHTLESKGRYTHMIWPVHCQIGSVGHTIHPAVLDAINAWELETGRRAFRLQKGMNPKVEAYSAVRPEVYDATDVNSGDNQKLLGVFNRCDRTIVAGEALSHCVKATVEHLYEHTPRYARDRAKKLVLLTDAMSPVGGFEAQGEAFVRQMAANGAVLAATQDVVL